METWWLNLISIGSGFDSNVYSPTPQSSKTRRTLSGDFSYRHISLATRLQSIRYQTIFHPLITLGNRPTLPGPPGTFIAEEPFVHSASKRRAWQRRMRILA